VTPDEAQVQARFAVKYDDPVSPKVVGVLLAELDAHGVAIARIRELHTKHPDEDYCSTCGPEYHTICCEVSAWPCGTIQAVDGRP
jgi:hypothetical protein